MIEPLSLCCGAPVLVEGNGTTHWWRCTCCGEPCDASMAASTEDAGLQGMTDEEVRKARASAGY